jgi:hypothetical protein
MPDIGKWVDVPVIQNLVKHAICSLISMLLGAVGLLIIRLCSFEQWVKSFLLIIDGTFIVGVFLWLVYQCLVQLWNNRIRIGNSNAILFA